MMITLPKPVGDSSKIRGELPTAAPNEDFRRLNEPLDETFRSTFQRFVAQIRSSMVRSPNRVLTPLKRASKIIIYLLFILPMEIVEKKGRRGIRLEYSIGAMGH